MTADVLIITGGLITSQERSLWRAARKCYQQLRHARHAWLDVKIKLAIAEPLVARSCELRRARRKKDSAARIAADYFQQPPLADVPDLTSVVLATCLDRAGITSQCVELSQLFDDSRRADELLNRAECVFLSTTYLHDLSELQAVVRYVKRRGQRLVVGGALVGILPDGWSGLPEIDIIAVGYGEYLVPALAEWIRSGYEHLPVPSQGRCEERDGKTFLFSGVPATRSLDELPTPDWRFATHDSQGPPRMVYYESVRGCPYRCHFCNYPYLFADQVFRYKSAEKMVDDWYRYYETLGVRYITCLDSLFTVPPERLVRFCELMIQRKVPIHWTCYARADDLAREDVVAMMKAAGAQQVQIGIESGDAGLLVNMNKNCSIEANRRALENCRRHDLTSVVSLIVGFPGETSDTLETTYQFLKDSPPDFYFLAAFSTRVAGVPLMRPEISVPLGLQVVGNQHSTAPYWRHHTMSCVNVGNHIRRLDQRLMRDRVALNATLFYSGLLGYRSEQRPALLEFQTRVATNHRWIANTFGLVHRWVDRRLRTDVERCFAHRPDDFEMSSERDKYPDGQLRGMSHAR